MLRSRSMSPAVKTYEDQLITNYFELLNKNRCTKKNRRYCTPEYLKADYSPYMSKQLQKPQSPSKQTPFNISESQCQRPFSAPGEKKRASRDLDEKQLAYNNNISCMKAVADNLCRRSQSSFRNQPPVIVVKAFRNGDLSFFTRVTAPDLPMLLEVCTKRLKLPFAARIVYLEDGTRVEHPLDIPKEAVIYVSMGEMFQDPKQKSKESLLDQIGSEWTLSGINLPVRKRKKKNPMTNRMRALTVKKNIRIIVYENGYSHKPIEIAADTNKMEEFMMDCTYKLKLRGFARHLYNWEGETVTDLNDTPILSDCLQQNNGLILGPLWVSKGEPFEPSGTGKYLLEQHKVLKQRLKYAKSQKQEHNSDISELEEALETIKLKFDHLETLKINSASPFHSKLHLMGTKGLRLRIYENGCVSKCKVFYFNLGAAYKGTNGNQEKLLQKFCDQLSISQRLCETQKPKIAPNVQKVFLSSGEELKDVLSLEYDEQIWLSFGEAYISPYTYCIQVIFDKANVQEHKEHSRVVRTARNDDASEKTSQWMAVDNFPRDIETTKVEQPFQEFDKNELEGTWHFLQNKINNNQVLFPEVVINHKLPRSNKELWPSNSQIWLISKNGVIYCKAMPQLCLAVYTDFWIKDQLLQEQELKVSGYVVGLQKKNNYDPNQTWIFNSNGTVSSKVYPVLLLTWLRNLLHESIKEEIVDNSDRSLKLGHNIYLIISEMLPKKHAALQRWAIKQERFDNLGQWKHTQVLNPEWNKLAYSWPVCMDTGTINEKYDWPMEGYLIPNAPQLYKNKNNGSKLSGIAPIRLMVLRNGERNLSKAVPVVGPNVTNMMKALSGKKRAKSAQCNTSDDAESSVQDENIHIGDRNLHCNPLTVRKLEFTMFLDSCTSTLKLPSSARRLFTDTGEELFTLQDLNRDQLVYVSCQERWLNPKVTASEQRRRFLLTQLASDLRKIRKYCNLRDQSNYVLTINKTLAPGSKLIVAPLIVSNSNPPKENSLESHASENLSFYGDNSHEEDKHNIKTYKSWHDISHIYSDEYINKLKWPWENLVNIDQCGNAEGKEDMYTQEDSVSEKQSFKNNSHGQHLTSPEGLQKFVYADSYIGCAENPNLVLTAMQSEGRSAEVVLKKRTPDNINQRWIIKSNGEIRSRFGHNMVLTVAMPVSETGGHASYIGCSVILKTKKENLYGEAHQRWYYDAETGYIKAFEADVLNKEITAANSSNICTFAITFKTKIDQPGYLVDVSQEQDFSTDQNISPKKLCLSCSYTLRGRCSMQKLKPGTEFSCAMGDQDPDLKRKRLSGSFQLLNGKVDLSTHEALLTLQVWEDKLLCFREETSMQTIGKEISAAQYINVIKLLAYKNGDGRLHSGHIVIGSTLEGLLMQCTRVLGLSNAARAMFTENGEQILDIEDLIKVAEKNYKKELTFHVENYIKEKLLKTSCSLETSNETSKDTYSNVVKQQDTSLESYADDHEDNKDIAVPEKRVNGDDFQKTTNTILNSIDLPALSYILRYPIEVWVSSNRKFVSPEAVESEEENRRKKRKIQAKIATELDTHKHILRLLKGRRFEELHPGKYEPTQDTDNPVVITGHWTDITEKEKRLQDKVNRLKDHLDEVNMKENSCQELKSWNTKTNNRLYKQRNMKRVLVYPVGESSKEHGYYVFGDTIEDILRAAEKKLNLRKTANYLFFENGKQVKSFECIKSGDVLRVSHDENFKSDKSEQNNVHLKAEWARAFRRHGPRITDMTVTTQNDPVGSPQILPGMIQTTNSSSSTSPTQKTTLMEPTTEHTESQFELMFESLD